MARIIIEIKDKYEALEPFREGDYFKEFLAQVLDFADDGELYGDITSRGDGGLELKRLYHPGAKVVDITVEED